ncbi:MAG: class I SAM-dependent methyltransferase [candidate division Zixibacteria bacterium]|nr:class I SAM-dependent methyltransferase [candidate division Zixibacteria bacterium]
MSKAGHEQNRKLWNEIADIHYQHPDYRVGDFLEGWCPLKSLELNTLKDVSGKHLLHLFCQFGMDSLAWARRGAIVTGVDISDRSIELAYKLRQESNINADFIRCDVLDLIGKMDAQFDIIFQSYGTLCWISDLNKWAEIVAHYLVQGGTFFIVDDHPIIYTLMEEGTSYFETNPQRYNNQYDYCDREYEWKEDSIEWQHSLSDIINALIKAGLTIESLGEYNKSYYAIERDWYEKDGYFYPPDGPPPYPLLFSLKARR